MLVILDGCRRNCTVVAFWVVRTGVEGVEYLPNLAQRKSRDKGHVWEFDLASSPANAIELRVAVIQPCHNGNSVVFSAEIVT